MAVDTRAVLHELLYSGLITIRLASSSSQRPMTDEAQEFVNAVANLLHNLPGELERASNKEDFDRILRDLWRWRRVSDEEWLRSNLTSRGVDPETLE